MSEEASNSDDAASFSSILENVRRMRQQNSISNGPPLATSLIQEACLGSGANVNSNQNDKNITYTAQISSSDHETAQFKTLSDLRDTIPSQCPKGFEPSQTTGAELQSIAYTKNRSFQQNLEDTTVSTLRILGRKHFTAAPYSLADILVHKLQQGNPLFEESNMKITPWKFDKQVLCDYYISPKVQILFLSLKYHKLRPEYLWHRLKKVNKGLSVIDTAPCDTVLRILLVVVDIDSHNEIIRDLLTFCVKHDMLLVLSWLFAEAGNYIVLAKQHERAPAKSAMGIRGVRGIDYTSSMIEAFTGIRRINKSDVSNLLANCKSAKNIVRMSTNQLFSNLNVIAGLGETKLKNLAFVFLQPFIYNKEYQDAL